MNGAKTPAQEALAQRLADLHRRHPAMTSEAVMPPAPDRAPSSRRTVVQGAPRTQPHALDVRLHGEAIADATATVERGSGVALLTVVVQQRHDALPVLAVRRYDKTSSSHAVAHSLARRIRRGTLVDVRGEGLALAVHDGHSVLRVISVQAIDPPPETTTRKDLA